MRARLRQTVQSEPLFAAFIAGVHAASHVVRDIHETGIRDMERDAMTVETDFRLWYLETYGRDLAGVESNG